MALLEQLPADPFPPLYQARRSDHRAVQMRQVHRALLAPLSAAPYAPIQGFRGDGAVVPGLDLSGFRVNTTTTSGPYAAPPGRLTVAPGAAFVAARPLPGSLDTRNFGHFYVESITSLPTVFDLRSNSSSLDAYGIVAIVVRDSTIPGYQDSADNWQLVDLFVQKETLQDRELTLDSVSKIVDYLRPPDVTGYLPLAYYVMGPRTSGVVPGNLRDLRPFFNAPSTLVVTDYLTLPATALPGQFAWLVRDNGDNLKGLVMFDGSTWKRPNFTLTGLASADSSSSLSLDAPLSFTPLVSLPDVTLPDATALAVPNLAASVTSLNITVTIPVLDSPPPAHLLTIDLSDSGLPLPTAPQTLSVNVHASPPSPDLPPALGTAVLANGHIKGTILPSPLSNTILTYSVLLPGAI